MSLAAQPPPHSSTDRGGRDDGAGGGGGAGGRHRNSIAQPDAARERPDLPSVVLRGADQLAIGIDRDRMANAFEHR
jgi:hypothetical protein